MRLIPKTIMLFALHDPLKVFLQNSMPGWDPLAIWNPTDAGRDPDCRCVPANVS